MSNVFYFVVLMLELGLVASEALGPSNIMSCFVRFLP
jgi:hypothetical protein